ncbi:hypothetical protein ACFYXL_00045 [Streptomyces tsukubensis]|uniref:hypothetical protein n=1 Tax=Streptomyces tsukubensis TaxID=83656 RepID=UPI0036ABD876
MSDQLPLLSYRLSTSPTPLQASTPETATQGRINVAVTADRDDVYCDWIQIAVPGDAQSGGAYFTEGPNFSTDSSEWALGSMVQVSGKHIGLASDALFYRAIFRYAGDDSAPIDGTVHFGLSGPLSSTTGMLDYHLAEHSDTSSDPEDYLTRRQVLPLPVTPPVFYLHTFLARDDVSASAPKTRFRAGSSVYLSWESNGSDFRLFDGNGNLVHEGPETFFTLAPGSLTLDTTFTLEGSMASSAGSGGSGFDPVYQYATLTLTVPDPTLAALTVRGGVDARSTLEVHGDTSLKSSLTVDGSAGVGNALTVSGSTEARSSLTVGGRLTARNSVDVEGGLDVAGTLNANGVLNARDSLNAYGQVEAVSSDHYVRIRELRGPYGEKISLNSNVEVLAECDVTIHEHLYVTKDIKINNYGVLSDRDQIGLYNTHYGGYLYASTYEKDSDRRIPYVWEPGDRVTESYWRISRD